MTARRTKPAPRGLDDLTWGERVNVVYRRQRQETGRVYEDIAGVVGQFHSADKSAIARLEGFVDLPQRESTRKLAYFTLLAYGYDPAEFGLNDSNVKLQGYDLRRVRDQLLRLNVRKPISPNDDTCNMSQLA